MRKKIRKRRILKTIADNKKLCVAVVKPETLNMILRVNCSSTVGGGRERERERTGKVSSQRKGLLSQLETLRH